MPAKAGIQLPSPVSHKAPTFFTAWFAGMTVAGNGAAIAGHVFLPFTKTPPLNGRGALVVAGNVIGRPFSERTAR